MTKTAVQHLLFHSESDTGVNRCGLRYSGSQMGYRGHAVLQKKVRKNQKEKRTRDEEMAKLFQFTGTDKLQAPQRKITRSKKRCHNYSQL